MSTIYCIDIDSVISFWILVFYICTFEVVGDVFAHGMWRRFHGTNGRPLLQWGFVQVLILREFWIDGLMFLLGACHGGMF